MKKSIVIILIAVVFLAACESSTLKNNDHSKTKTQTEDTKVKDHSDDESSDQANSEKYVTTTNNKKGQTFRLISAYKWVNEYVQKAKDTNNESTRWDLWQKVVMNHVQVQCLSGAYSHLVDDFINFPPKDLESLKNDIELLNAANAEDTTLEALKASAKKFPGPDTTVCLFPQGSSNSSGVTLDAGKISIFYSPYLSNIFLKSTVAHEYHHSAWTSKYGEDYKWNLLGSIIFEGKAEYFASLLYQPSSAKMTAMNKKEEGKIWYKIKDSLHTSNQDKKNTVLFGGKKAFQSISAMSPVITLSKIM